MALSILKNHMQAIICSEQVIACIVFSGRYELKAASVMSAMRGHIFRPHEFKAASEMSAMRGHICRPS